MAKKMKNREKNVSSINSNAEIGKLSLWESHPNWLALGVIFILLMIFFQPMIFENKTTQLPDTMAARSIQPFVKDNLTHGTYPLWNPYIFGGMPSFASLMSAPYVDVVGTIVYGVIWTLQRIFPLPDFFRIFFNFFLLGAFLFILFRSKKIDAQVALFGSLAFMFMPEVVGFTASGHNTKLAVIAFLPIIFILVERLLEKQNLLFFSLTGLAVGLQLLRAHVQMCFYTYVLILSYAIFWGIMAIKDKESVGKILKAAGLLAGAMALGAVISSVLNLSVWEYSHYSIRGGGASGGLDYDYATAWSFPPSEILTFFVPSFMGFGNETYWGPMAFTHFPMYFGIIILFMAGLGALLDRSRLSRFFLIFGLVILVISFGKHFPVLYAPLFKILPFFNKFRAPKMILILFDFSMAVLACLGLQGLVTLAKQIKEDAKNQIALKMKTRVMRYGLIFTGIVVLLLLVLLIGKGAYLGWAAKAGEMAASAHSKAVADAWVSLLFSSGALLLMWMLLSNKIGTVGGPVLISGLLLFDLWHIDHKIVEPQPKGNEEAYFRATPEVEFLKHQEGPFRILALDNQRPPNWYMYHKIENVYGYSAAKLRIYQDMLEAFDVPQGFIEKYLKIVNDRYALKSPEEIDSNRLSADRAFLKMLNVKYVLASIPFPDSTLEIVYPPQQRGLPAVFQFKQALNRVYFPKDVQVMKDSKAILAYMAGGGFDPEKTAIIEKEPPFSIQYSPENQAKITERDIHHLTIKADIQTPAFMAVSEIYYPAGWKATVNGKEAEIYQTDYVTRGLFLEPGKQTIRFDFAPETFAAGFWISLSAILLLCAGVFFGWKKEKDSVKP